MALSPVNALPLTSFVEVADEWKDVLSHSEVNTPFPDPPMAGSLVGDIRRG